MSLGCHSECLRLCSLFFILGIDPDDSRDSYRQHKTHNDQNTQRVSRQDAQKKVKTHNKREGGWSGLGLGRVGVGVGVRINTV